MLRLCAVVALLALGGCQYAHDSWKSPEQIAAERCGKLVEGESERIQRLTQSCQQQVVEEVKEARKIAALLALSQPRETHVYHHQDPLATIMALDPPPVRVELYQYGGSSGGGVLGPAYPPSCYGPGC